MDAQLFASRNTNRKISRGQRERQGDELLHSQLCLICPTDPKQAFLIVEAENFYLHLAKVKGTLENIYFYLMSNSVIFLDYVLNCTELDHVGKELNNS